jgi:hypothetical protein
MPHSARLSAGGVAARSCGCRGNLGYSGGRPATWLRACPIQRSSALSSSTALSITTMPRIGRPVMSKGRADLHLGGWPCPTGRRGTADRSADTADLRPHGAETAGVERSKYSAGRTWARPSPITLRGPPSTCLRHASRPIGAEARCAGFAFRAMPQWWFCAQLAVLQFMSAAGLLGAVAEMWRPSGRGTRCPGFPTYSPAQGWWWCWLLQLIWGPTALAGHCLGRLVVNRHHGAVLRCTPVVLHMMAGH